MIARAGPNKLAYDPISTTNVELSPSKRKNDKFKAVSDNRKTVNFGAKEILFSLCIRMKTDDAATSTGTGKDEDWGDYTTAGFYAKHLLWDRPCIPASSQHTNK